MVEIAIIILIILNLAQLIYANYQSHIINHFEAEAKKFVVAFNEIMTVVNVNADTQRRGLESTEQHDLKIDYLMMCNDVLFKALPLEKVNFRADSEDLPSKILNSKILEDKNPNPTD